MKLWTLVAVLAFAAASFFVMIHVKTDVQQLHNDRQALIYKQRVLRETIKVQQAEIAHLTDPSRLDMLAVSAGMRDVELNQILPVNASYLLGDDW